MQRNNDEFILSPLEAAAAYPSIMAFGISTTPVAPEFTDPLATQSLVSSLIEKGVTPDVTFFHSINLLNEATTRLIGIDEDVVFSEPTATIVEQGLIWTHKNQKLIRPLATVAIVNSAASSQESLAMRVLLQQRIIANLDLLVEKSWSLAQEVYENQQRSPK